MHTQLKHFAVHIKDYHNIVNQLYSNKQRKIKHRDGTGRGCVHGLPHTSTQSFFTLLSFTSLLGSFPQWVITQQIQTSLEPLNLAENYILFYIVQGKVSKFSAFVFTCTKYPLPHQPQWSARWTSLIKAWRFPGGSVTKDPPANARDSASISESRGSPGEGNGNPLQYSCLGILIDRGAWQATVHAVAKGSDTT